MIIDAFLVGSSGLTRIELSNVSSQLRRSGTWIQVEGSIDLALEALRPVNLDSEARAMLLASDLPDGVTRKSDFILWQTCWSELTSDLSAREQRLRLLLGDSIVIAVVPEAFPIKSEDLVELTPRELIRKSGTDAVLWAFSDQLVRAAQEQLRVLERVVRDEEKKLIETSTLENSDQVRLFNINRSLTAIRLSILPMREHVGALYRYDVATNQALHPYFLDLQGNLDRLANYSSEVRGQIAGLLDVNLALENQRQTLVTKRISAWAAIVAVPTAITGFFGQNLPVFGAGQPLGVAVSTALIAVTSLSLYVGFKRKDWL